MSKGKSTSTTSIEIPEWQKQQMQQIFQAASGLAGQPFVPYTGPRVAGFSPDQLAAFGGARQLYGGAMSYDPRSALYGLAGAGAPQYGQADAYGGTTVGPVKDPRFRGITGADIAQYQDPYEKQVVKYALGDIRREQRKAQERAGAQAIGAGAFGGSRSAIIEAEAQKPYVREAARTAAELRSKGYSQALDTAMAEAQRRQQMQQFRGTQAQQRALAEAGYRQQAGMADYQTRAQMALGQPQLEMQQRQLAAGLYGDLLGEQYRAQGLLSGMGAQQQALQQRGLDASYAEFMRALGYGPQQLGLLQAGMGTPLTGQSQQQQYKPGLGDYLGSALQLYGLFGNPFGSLFGGGGSGGGFRGFGY